MVYIRLKVDDVVRGFKGQAAEAQAAVSIAAESGGYFPDECRAGSAAALQSGGGRGAFDI